MRTLLMAAVLVAGGVVFNPSFAGEGCTTPGASAGNNHCNSCNNCDDCACGRAGCGLLRNGGCRGCGHCKGNIDGLDRYFNCGCNGSYNYPVPPLYTYHWPGMYKQVRMTDYHSPYRFPPIKRYADEPLPETGHPAKLGNSSPAKLRAVSSIKRSK